MAAPCGVILCWFLAVPMPPGTSDGAVAPRAPAAAKVAAGMEASPTPDGAWVNVVPPQAAEVPAAPTAAAPVQPPPDPVVQPAGALPPTLVPLGPAPQTPAPSNRGPWLGVPVASWVSFGTAAALFGTGLAFGLASVDIDHRANYDLSASGVDLGLTRATAVAGRNDAIDANAFFLGAGAALIAGLTLAILATPPAAPAP